MTSFLYTLALSLFITFCWAAPSQCLDHEAAGSREPAVRARGVDRVDSALPERGPTRADEGGKAKTRGNESPELEKIRAAIKEKGARWDAGNNRIFMLPPEERKMLVGSEPPSVPQGQRFSLMSPGSALFSPMSVTLPSRMDWRSEGAKYVTEVRDQGSCGGCWAFASTALLEARTLIDMDTPGLDLDLSEQLVISCANMGSCSGGGLVSNFMVDTGVPLESCYPYTQSNGSCSNACADWRDNTYKTTSTTWIIGPGQQQDAAALKDGLFNYGPLAVDYAVYSDFYSYSSGIYSHVYGSLVGYHSVLLVGYDDTNSCFIVKNSWGPSWGEDGYFRIAYTELTNDVDFAYRGLAYGEALPDYLSSAVSSPADGAGVKETTCTVTGMARAGSGSTIQKVEVSTDGGSSWETANGTTNWSYAWTPPGEGTYNIKTRVTDNAAGIETPGPGVTVTVDFTDPSSAITAPAQGTDIASLSYTITGTADDGAGSGVMVVEISADGGANWEAATGTSGWSYEWTPPLAGAYTITSRATDIAGNVETPGAGVDVNVVWPSSSITSPSGGQTLSGASFTVTGTAADNSGTGLYTVEVSTDGGANWDLAAGTGSWSYDWALPLVEADYTVTSRATDNAANIETPKPGVTVLVDNAGPVPHAQWTRLAGTPSIDYCKGVGADSEGYVYIAGHTDGSMHGNASAGGYDLFLTKYDRSGKRLWTTQLGSSSYEYAMAMGVDSSGNAYVCGITGGEMEPGALVGSGDIYLAKFDPDGGVVWVRQMGTGEYEKPFDVELDPSGNAYITGITWGDLAGYNNAGDYDMFVVKYDTDGIRKWTRLYGTYKREEAYGIAVDGSGNVFVTGQTDGAFSGYTNSGSLDIFIVKYDTSGNRLWTRQEGSSSSDEAYGAAADNSGNVIITGRTAGSLAGCSSLGSWDVFALKYGPDGERLWARQAGTSSYDYGWNVWVDEYDNAYLCWGPSTCRVTKMDKFGHELWTTSLGSCNPEALTVDGYGNIYTCGHTWTGLDGNVYNGGQSDAMVKKLPAQAVTIEHGDSYTASESVTLVVPVLDRSTPSEMRFSNYSGTGWSAWQPYAQTAAWTLETGDGEKTVYATFKDSLGNVSPQYSDTIYLEMSDPATALADPSGGALLGGAPGYTVTGTAQDTGGSGLVLVEVSTDGGTNWEGAADTSADGSWSTFEYYWSFPASGGYTLKSRGTDLAGNVETPGPGVSVTVDITTPSSAITSPASGGSVTGASFTITGTAEDGAGSGVTLVEVSTDGGGTWNTASGTANWSYDWTLPAESTYTLKSRATDAAGNVETPGPGITAVVDNSGPGRGGALWTRQLGTSSNDEAHAVATGPGGDAYVAGYTRGGMPGYSNAGQSDLVLIKYDKNGNKLWNRQMGTSSSDEFNGVSTDASGNVYAAGFTSGNLDGNTGMGGADTCIVKYWPSGSKQWTRQIGASGADGAWGGIVSGADGASYLAGYAYNSLPGNTSLGGYDYYLIKYDNAGVNGLTLQKGTNNADYGRGVCMDAQGNIYVAGDTAGGLDGYANAGAQDLFLVKFAPGGGRLWTRQMGSSSNDYAYGVAADPYGNTYVAGQTAGPLDGNANIGGEDIFIVKHDKNGNRLWSRLAGTGGNDYAKCVASDADGCVYVAGNTQGAFDGFTGAGGGDIFVMKFDPDGNVLWSWQTGSSGYDAAHGICVDESGNLFVAGYTGGTLQGQTSAGSYDIFLMKLASNEMTINSGAATTDTAGVTLDFYVSDPSGITEMRISNDGVFDSEPWQPFTASAAWSLTPGDGPKTVYAMFKDTLGFESPAYSDSITLKAAPASAITYPSDGSMVSPPCTITGTATDGVNPGILSVEVSTDGGGTWSAAADTSGNGSWSSWSYGWSVPVSGDYNIKSRSTDDLGAVEYPGPGVNVTVFNPSFGSPELVHFDWAPFLTGGDCTTCHVASGTFLQPDYMDSPGFCSSCHSAASVGHETALEFGGGHPVMASVTSAGCTPPTYGNITAARYNNQPFAKLVDTDKISCITCHNVMSKTEDYGRTWEMTSTSDNRTYNLQGGGWDTRGRLEPVVYRDESLWSGPTYSRDKKQYLVSPAEYTFDETAGTVTFSAAQDPADYIYVSLGYPYLRASSEGNRLCKDCHPQSTHRGLNCLVCHRAHGTANIAGIRELVRTTDLSERAVSFVSYTGRNSFADGDAVHDGICEVCHSTTLYYKRDGSGFASHTGGNDYDGDDCTACHGHLGGFDR